jgi:hypothetical protein
MPIPTNVFKCCVCLTPFEDYTEACICDAKGLPTGPRLVAGTMLNYENEDTLFGTRYSYTSNTGIVICSFAYYSRETQSHEWAHILKDEANSREVVVVKGQYGPCSPAEQKYNPGYADAYKQSLLKYANALAYPIHY